MRNREDPTQRAQELTLAAGAASLLLSTMVNRVADKRLREREANGAWRHGMATSDAIAARREVAQLVRAARKQIAVLRVLPQFG